MKRSTKVTVARSAGAKRRTRPVGLEYLEGRRMLDASFNVQAVLEAELIMDETAEDPTTPGDIRMVDGGFLRIEGTREDDHVLVSSTAIGHTPGWGDQLAITVDLHNSVGVQNNVTVYMARRGFNAIQFKGYSGNDFFQNHTDLPSSLSGGSGWDTLHGGEAEDTLEGGSGLDELYGGEGEDRLRGGPQSDKLVGGAHSDVLEGGGGNDWLYGDNGSDQLMFYSGNDTLRGGTGHDWLEGEGGQDELHGQSGDDVLDDFGGKIFGGLGADVFVQHGYLGSTLTDRSVQDSEVDHESAAYHGQKLVHELRYVFDMLADLFASP